MVVGCGWWIPVGAAYVPARLPVFRSLHNLGQSPCGDLDSPVGACALNTGQRRILTQPVYLFSDAIENPNPTKTPSDRLCEDQGRIEYQALRTSAEYLPIIPAFKTA